jgi:polyvinyl alcohol dehydrogenase (cytochrome)
MSDLGAALATAAVVALPAQSPVPAPACSWGQPCSAACHSPPTSIPSVIFAGAFDGHGRAYATKDGQLLWDSDAGHSFDAVNGGQATGGSIDQGGQQISGSRLFVNSGARNGYPGNLLVVSAIGGSDGQRTLAH